MSKKSLIRWPDNPQEHAAFARQFLRYEPTTGFLYWVRNRHRVSAGDIAGNRQASGYIQIEIAQKNMRAHRVCWLLHYGAWPSGVIDHIDGNPSNNRIDNLRDVDQSQNMRNSQMRSNNGSGITGVSWCSERQLWTARIKCPDTGAYKYLGRYAEQKSAAEARQKAEREMGYHPNHGRQKAGALLAWKNQQNAD